MLIREEIFLGVPITEDTVKKLSALEPAFIKFFINDQGDYLRQINYGGKAYLGKAVSSLESLLALDLLESNIYSLIKKIDPTFPCQKGKMWLFPILTNDKDLTDYSL